jgi:hypothetical protein
MAASRHVAGGATIIGEDVVRLLARCLTVMLFLSPGLAFAQTSDLIVEKKTFELPSYTTVAGATINNVKIGWESAGTLNADKSNASSRETNSAAPAEQIPKPLRTTSEI